MLHLTPESIIDYVHNELSTEADASAFVHLQGCGECAMQLQEEQEMRHSLRSRANAQEREFPSSLAAAIRTATAAKPKLWFGERALFWLRPVVFLGTASLGVVIALHLPLSEKSQPHSTVTAAVFFSQHEAMSVDSSLTERSRVPSIETAAFTSDDQATSAN